MPLIVELFCTGRRMPMKKLPGNVDILAEAWDVRQYHLTLPVPSFKKLKKAVAYLFIVRTPTICVNQRLQPETHKRISFAQFHLLSG